MSTIYILACSHNIDGVNVVFPFIKWTACHLMLLIRMHKHNQGSVQATFWVMSHLHNMLFYTTDHTWTVCNIRFIYCLFTGILLIRMRGVISAKKISLWNYWYHYKPQLLMSLTEQLLLFFSFLHLEGVILLWDFCNPCELFSPVYP